MAEVRSEDVESVNEDTLNHSHEDANKIEVGNAAVQAEPISVNNFGVQAFASE